MGCSVTASALAVGTWDSVLVGSRGAVSSDNSLIDPDKAGVTAGAVGGASGEDFGIDFGTDSAGGCCLLGFTSHASSSNPTVA